MGTLIEDLSLRNREPVFTDREDAGRTLSRFLGEFAGTDALVLAIPSGGVPVGREIARTLSLGFDLIIVRKIKIPWNPEAGFGAVNLDGDVILNQDLLASLRLSRDAADAQIQRARENVAVREQAFRHGRDFPDMKGKTVLLVDDGLASGYTMRAALAFTGRRMPRRVIVAVPTGSHETIRKILPLASAVVCPNVREGYPYAVASAYRHWHDLGDEEVLRILGN